MKTKKIGLNIISDVIPLLIISILGIFKVKIFINYLGNDTFGLYNLFNSIMLYLTIIDGGIANALLFSLYKPNVENNYRKFNALLRGGFKTFSKIGMYVFGIAFLVSFVAFFFIKNSPFDYWYIVITFLLFAISNVISYFFVPYGALLEVKEKKYIYNLIMQGSQIILSVLEIIMLLMGYSFISVLIMHAIIRILSHILEIIICKRLYPNINLRDKEKDFSFKKYLPSLFFHKICGLIGNNVDIVLISSFLGLESVAIYSAYSYIINMMMRILEKLSSSMTAIVGNTLVKNKQEMYNIFMEYRAILFYVAIVICVPLTLAINGFINLYYDNKIEVSFLIAFSFCMSLFISVIRLCTTVFVQAGGLYDETKKCAIVDTIINLLLSFILIQFIGIPGVLIATMISIFVAEYIMKTIVIHKELFKKSSKFFFIKNIKLFILYFIDLFVGYKIIDMFTINNLVCWVTIFLIYTILNAIAILIVFKLLKEENIIKRLKILIQRG